MSREVLTVLLLSVYFSCICGYFMSLVHSRGILRAIRTGGCTLPSIGKHYFSKQIRNTALKCLDTDSQVVCNDIEASVWDNLYKNIFSDAKEDVKCLLAVSGGSDSIAMLHILKAIKDTYKVNISMEVINFNHKARPESDEEVNFLTCATLSSAPTILFFCCCRHNLSLPWQPSMNYHTMH